MTSSPRIEDLLRPLAPQVLGTLVRRYGHFDAAEDATQEALLAAATQWPRDGTPANPRGWLVTVGARRLIDELRSEGSRRRREASLATADRADQAAAPAADEDLDGSDDSLTLLFLCCHPQLSPPAQIALTLRSVGGLTTGEIARAFLVPEPTMAQRITRAKARIRDVGGRFEQPAPGERSARLAAVLRVLYLIFNEGYTSSSGPDLHRPDLTAEAIRLTRELHRQLPDDGEVTGLLALMLLTEARRPARSRPDGGLIPLADQDRARWDGDRIREGVALVEHALTSAPLGPYQVQAAIAAVHDEAPSAEETDWREILGLYDLLERLEPGPMVTLNRAVAVALVRGPRDGLALLATLDGDGRIGGHHRLLATRAHLLELAGEPAEARTCYLAAARRTTSTPEKRYLEGRAAQLRPAPEPPPGAP